MFSNTANLRASRWMLSSLEKSGRSSSSEALAAGAGVGFKRGAGVWSSRGAGVWSSRGAGVWSSREAGVWSSRGAGVGFNREAGVWLPYPVRFSGMFSSTGTSAGLR